MAGSSFPTPPASASSSSASCASRPTKRLLVTRWATHSVWLAGHRGRLRGRRRKVRGRRPQIGSKSRCASGFLAVISFSHGDRKGTTMTALLMNMAEQRSKELRDYASARRIAGQRRFSLRARPPFRPLDEVSIRRLGEADTEALDRVAGRDSSTRPAGEVLGAELDGRLIP